jgi:hypothetical protein
MPIAEFAIGDCRMKCRLEVPIGSADWKCRLRMTVADWELRSPIEIFAD